MAERQAFRNTRSGRARHCIDDLFCKTTLEQVDLHFSSRSHHKTPFSTPVSTKYSHEPTRPSCSFAAHACTERGLRCDAQIHNGKLW